MITTIFEALRQELAIDVSVLVRTFIAVFVLADAFGNSPIVLVLTQGMEAPERNHVIDRATIVATTVLLGFAFVGQPILNYLHISIASLQVAGGLVLLLISLDMLNGKLEEPAVESGRDVAITPLALPLLAGPGTLTSTALMMAESSTAHLSVLIGIVAAMFVSWIIFRQATRIFEWIGNAGAIIVTKLLGFLLAALAVEIGSEGLKILFFS